MRFTVIGHACLLVEAGEARLLVDPWLAGSCYWGSWWHHPRAREDLVEPAAVSAIYYTHEHPDHLHLPSLERFPRTVRILIPRFPLDRIGPALGEQGFPRVEEIPHAGRSLVGPLRLYSYQYGLDDSVAVVTDGETTLINLNDAKPSGRALAQIRRRHAPADFVLRSHAPAQAYPFCYTADVPEDLSLIGVDDYTRAFAAAVRSLNPRWAIPFASNVRHLHPESREQNAFLVSPAAVVEACRGRVGASEVVAIAPGDSWSRETGFTRAVPHESSHAAGTETPGDERVQTVPASTEGQAAAVPIGAAALGAYLEGFARAIPWPFRRAYPARVAFALGDGTHLVADLLRRSCVPVRELPPDLHSCVYDEPRLLHDAVEKRCLNLVGISKRIRVHLRRGGLVCDAAFWGLLSLYELHYLPLRRLLTPRAVGVLASRWRELLGYPGVFVRPSRSLEALLDTWEPG
jgi:UDP-MurNAc hydroxylase